MPVSSKRKITRVDAKSKHYEMVTFKSELFGEEPFTFPDQKHMTMKLVTALNMGDIGALTEWLTAAGVDKAEVEALGELEQGEVEGFMAAWSDGSLASLPKSSA